ncbi:group II intron reverse transcriptase/maturase [Bacillus cereus]|uniref:group II intron reverse transcriptase/maturase n=1 Tax=Bacillus cereus TaxID=1396 RepID=UPI003D65A991
MTMIPVVKHFTDDIAVKKRKFLRHNEYYDTQSIYDSLYERSKSGITFKNLMKYITDKRNILLAYRTIKDNYGSNTSGFNGHTIDHWGSKPTEEYIEYIRRRLSHYIPHKVRRVYIPKANGKLRPLGIPTIEDRLVQQCIKQVLEPICEAKFHNNSYGFRPNRSTEHAISAFSRYINISKMHYVVDIDIKGFFDNVNHSKLMKQLWSMGIRDKNLLCIISKLLKAEIDGEGIPTKGTPQGGILSPLLSNIVLNEFDWWISDQWETFTTKRQYQTIHPTKGSRDNSSKYRALRKSRLKEVYIVRYADDFKLICKDLKTARIMYKATEQWLHERLGLDISQDKSKITHVTESASEFLGLSIKANKKGNRYVVHSHMTDKAMKTQKEKLRKLIKKLQREPTAKNAGIYNATVLGIQNYYKIATHVNIDMNKLAFDLSGCMRNRLKHVASNTGFVSETYKKFYKNNYRKRFISNCILFPLGDIKSRTPLGFNHSICNYTEEGRSKIHDNLKNYDMSIVSYMMNNYIENMSTEYNDNRISLYIAQYGKCGVSKVTLEIGDMECHHKKPKHLGGGDEYKNLIFITKNVHKLIHATNEETIRKYLKLCDLDAKGMKKLNALRKEVGNNKIDN